MSRRPMLLCRLLLAALVILPALALAHKPSDSYLILRADGTARLHGQWDIALRDLEYAIGLDANGDGDITWGELKARHGEIAAYALSRFAIRADGHDCPLSASGHLYDQHSDGGYAVLQFEADCGQAPASIEARYALFFDFDTQHKGLLRLQSPTGTRIGVFSADRTGQRFDLGGLSTASSAWASFTAYVREGVWHIWIGIDHVLFILSLLLPSVLVVGRRRWLGAPHFAPAFWDVLKVVTSFTVAHSITLSLAALGLVSLPSRLVESTIAASVVLAALNNIYPLITEKRWLVAFVFGLVHGFGFASVLADLGLPSNALLVALVGFNLGVEMGQLAIVAAFVPLAYAVRNTPFYRWVLLTGGSAMIALVAFVWLIERAFDLKILGA
jgi:hypothetical protein